MSTPAKAIIWEDTAEKRYPQPQPARNSEFDKQFPPEIFGDEASDNARVWRAYRATVTQMDKDLVTGWNETLTVLLVFGGLFSTVLSAFLLEASKSLQQDSDDMMVKGIYAILSQLNSSIVPQPQLPLIGQLTPEPRARLVAGLWYSSLSLTLIVSLLVILAKQWLVDFDAKLRAPVAHARRWAWRHRVYRDGLDAWQVGLWISLLTLGLHVALVLFLIGLLLFLFDLDKTICYISLAMTSAMLLFYVVATFRPLFAGACPWTTPLLSHLRILSLRFKWVCNRAPSYVKRKLGLQLPPYGTERFEERFSPGPAAFEEYSLLLTHHPLRDAQVLSWMISFIPQGDEVRLAVNAIGSLDLVQHFTCFESIPSVINPLAAPEIGQAVERQLRKFSPASTDVLPAVQALRSLLFVRRPIDVPISKLLLLLHHTATYDAVLLAMMAAARQRSHSHGSDPDHNWAHTPALTELSKWYDRQENATAPPPMAKSTLVMLVEDFRAAAAFGSLPDLDMVHLSVLVILHDGDVSENSAISLIVSKAEAVLLRFITPIFQLVTEFEKQRLPNAVGPQMQMLAYWSFLLEHSAQLALAPGNINLHLAAYERMLKRSGRENDAPGLRGVPSRSTANNDTAPWPNIYIERLFSFFAGPNTYAAEWSWSDSSISATAEIIDATLKQYRGSGWTPRMGSIMFRLFRKFKPALPDHVRWAGTLLSSLVKIPRGHPPIDSVKSIEHIEEHITGTSLNILRPRSIQGETSGTILESIWAIAMRLDSDGDIVRNLAEVAHDFSVEMELLANKISGSAETLEPLVQQLVGGPRGLSLAKYSATAFVDVARHCKVVSVVWWGETMQELLEADPIEWRSFIEDHQIIRVPEPETGSTTTSQIQPWTGPPTLSRPQDIVAAISASSHCDECHAISAPHHCFECQRLKTTSTIPPVSANGEA